MPWRTHENTYGGNRPTLKAICCWAQSTEAWASMNRRKWNSNAPRRSSRMTHRRTMRDRKSTRLNSSHLGISYAVFLFKKKSRRDTPLPNRPSLTRGRFTPPPTPDERYCLHGEEATAKAPLAYWVAFVNIFFFKDKGPPHFPPPPPHAAHLMT